MMTRDHVLKTGRLCRSAKNDVNSCKEWVLIVRQVNNHNNSIYLYVLTFYNHRYVITINMYQAHFLRQIKTYIETFNKIHSPTANYNAWPGNLYFFLLYTVDKFIFTPCIIFVVLHLERISPISNSSRHSRV